MEKKLDDVLDPPDIPRKIRFYISQWILIPLFILAPLVVGLGILDDKDTQFKVETPEFLVEVNHTEQMLVGTQASLFLKITNKSSEKLSNLTVQFDETFIKNLHHLESAPPLSDGFSYTPIRLDPEKSFNLALYFEPKKYFKNEGKIRLYIGPTEKVQIPFKLTVLP